MKITDVKTYMVGAIRRNWVFIEIETDSGIVGVGEATLEGFAKTMVSAVEDFKRMLIGLNPLEIEKIWEDLYRRKFWRGNLLILTALSGIEMALWDIKGKEAGKPVYDLLGGPTYDKIKAYGNYWFLGADGKFSNTVEHYAESAAKAVENGWQALKWSPFGKPAHNVTHEEEDITIECVKRVREAVGENVDLLVDAHGRFNLPTAIRIAQRLEPYKPFFFEEPLPPENMDSLRELKLSTKTPIATGERLVTRYQFLELLNKYAVNYIQPDIAHCGGIAEMKKIANLAEAFYIPVVPHNPLGPVATAASIHLAASITNFEILEYIPCARQRRGPCGTLGMGKWIFHVAQETRLGG